MNSVYDTKRSKRSRLRLASDEVDMSVTLRMQTGHMCWSESSATSIRNAAFRCLSTIYDNEPRKRLTHDRNKRFDSAFSEIQPFLGTTNDVSETKVLNFDQSAHLSIT